VLGPVDGLVDRERTHLGGARRLKLAKVLLHDAKVAKHPRDVGVLWPVDSLADRERTLQ
jgi:hypothetical protein